MNELARLPDQGIAGVIVGEEESGAVLGLDLLQGVGVIDRGGEGLVADHMDARFEKSLGGGEMHVIGRDDRHRFDAVLVGRFGAGHFGEIGVDAVFRQAQILA